MGLGLVSAPTALLKPDAATMVGKLYATHDDRRDARFAPYCTAINIGAFAGLLITGGSATTRADTGASRRPRSACPST